MMKLLHLLTFLFVAIDPCSVRLVESASARLTKHCFDRGEIVNIRFLDIFGEGIFVGLYPVDEVPNRQALPEIQSPSLKKWVLSCGRRDNCESWPTRGLVQLPTDGLEEADYFIAVSGNRNGLTPQAITRSFHVGDCSPSNFFSAPGEAPTNRPITLGPTPSVVVADSPSLPEAPIVQDIPFPEPAPTPRPVPIPAPTQNPRNSFVVLSGAINAAIDDARIQIEDLIRRDGDLTGKFLRLVFHDCIGGCDGCVDMANPDNAGLDKPVSMLQPIADRFSDRGLTRTDIWMLAGLVATETAIPPDDRDILFDLQWVGRRTCEEMIDCGVDFRGNPSDCTPMRGPHVGQAHATLGTRSIQSFFENEFDFTPQQVTALMGAHTVGRMSRQNSGFSGRWDLSETSFDGGYWIELLGEPPDFRLEDVNNDDIPGTPNRRQWGGIVRGTSHITMLHTDIALVRNLDDMRGGSANCDFNGPRACSQDTPFMPHARRYNADNRLWLFDFRDVFTILIDHGHEKTADCPSGRICTFGFESPNTLPTESIGQPSPSVPDAGHNGARVSVNKRCYDHGETIVVNYDNISGQNVWIGILPLDAVTDFRNLPVGPESQSDLLKEWKLSCGNNSCHTWMSSGGLQLPTGRLEENEYVVVISGDGGSLEGQALTTFVFGRC